MVKLIEFKNFQKNILRGILTYKKQIKKNYKNGVIFVGGFERSSSVEPKFKRLAESLEKYDIPSFRFDYAGCGLSDGDFKFTTIQSITSDLLEAIKSFKKETGIKQISVVAHSLGACAVAEIVKNKPDFFKKVVLISPALNQKELLRYWFAIKINKNNALQTEITWKNYKHHFSEKDFLADCKTKNRMTKINYINPQYFLSAQKSDYTKYFQDILSKTLIIIGQKDHIVPVESLKIDTKNIVVVPEGDHDIERPDFYKKWSKKAFNFLTQN